MKGKRQIVNGIFVVLISSMLGMALPSQARQRPQIVVGVVIDGLDMQYIDMLRDKFGDGGFNRLFKEGVVLTSVDYGTNVDATAAVAMIMTGASPSTTSVTGANSFNRETLKIEASMSDPEVLGNYTGDTFSPRNLAVSTLSDEVRISGGGVYHVYGVSADAAQAVILAGHSGNSALWLDNKSGNWASSTYYKNFPTSATYRNRMKPLSVRLDTMAWTAAFPASAYHDLPQYITTRSFRHVFGGADPIRYEKFAASALVNTEITDVALDLIDELPSNVGEKLDMINVVYNLKPFDFKTNADNRYELIDSYLRLDKDLSRLFKKADDFSGHGNALFFVAGTPPSAFSRRDEETWMIPYGEFSAKKAKSLMNMYLIARFGNGDWVTAFHNDRFYLNQKLIADMNLDAAAVRTEAAAFLEKMSGVDKVFTLDEIMGGRGDARLEALQRNTDASSAADLFVEVAPGWETLDDLNTPVADNRVRYVHRYTAPVAPVFIVAPEIKTGVINTPVDVRTIAPTVARLLRIRPPNAAMLPPIVL